MSKTGFKKKEFKNSNSLDTLAILNQLKMKPFTDFGSTICLKALENTSATTTGGSILQNVSQDTLKRISVIIPPKDIITAYNEKILAIFKSQLSIQKEIEVLSKLRDNLLPLLMNGQVTLNSCLSLIIHLYNTIFARFNFTTRNSKYISTKVMKN